MADTNTNTVFTNLDCPLLWKEDTITVSVLNGRLVDASCSNSIAYTDYNILTKDDIADVRIRIIELVNGDSSINIFRDVEGGDVLYISVCDGIPSYLPTLESVIRAINHGCEMLTFILDYDVE